MIRVLIIFFVTLSSPYTFACAAHFTQLGTESVELEFTPTIINVGDPYVWRVGITTNSHYKKGSLVKRIYGISMVSTEGGFFEAPIEYWTGKGKAGANFFISDEMIKKIEVNIRYGFPNCTVGEIKFKLSPEKSLPSL